MEVQNKISEKWSGKDLDEFVLKHGTPQSSYTLNSGDIVYKWRSDSSSYTQNVGNMAFTDDMYCEIQIITTPQKVIKEIRIIKDNTGAIISLCNKTLK